MEKIPEIGKTYHFFDDGKITMMRHSMATVTRILSIVDAKNEMFNLIDYSDWNTEKETWENQIPYKISLFQIWRNEVEDCSWIYAPDTDYFVECSIPEFDENPIWFVRTVDGGWFSLDIQSGWQAAYIAWRANQPLTEIYEKSYLRDGVTYGISGDEIDYLTTPDGTEFKDKIEDFMNSAPSDVRFKEDIPFEMLYSEDFY